MPGAAHSAYVRRMRRPPALLLAAALTSLAALAGCSIGGGERVGGEPVKDAHELTMLTIFDEAKQFTDEVSRLSEGGLRIRVVPVEPQGVEYEAAVLRRMQAGEADLGLVGTRAWDDFGAPGLAALGAPFLLDSYPLQERVFTSDLVEPILEELRPAGFEGIGLLPGPLRRPFGLAGALAAPDDFRGLAIGTQQSNVADATLRALGANPASPPERRGRTEGASRARRGRVPGSSHRERPSRRARLPPDDQRQPLAEVDCRLRPQGGLQPAERRRTPDPAHGLDKRRTAEGRRRPQLRRGSRWEPVQEGEHRLRCGEPPAAASSAPGRRPGVRRPRARSRRSAP